MGSLGSKLFYWVGVVVPLVAACMAASESQFADSKGNGDDAPQPTEGFAPGVGSSDGGLRGPIREQGSPLCGSESVCSPDDDGTATLAKGAAGCEPDSDAGLGGATDAAASGCRLGTTDGGGACYPANRRGVDGAHCEHGSDCAPGFDCVEAEKGSVCRRYCCSGTCEGQTSQNGEPTFCDVRKLVDVNPRKAPVCMPVKRCTLLDPESCEPKETCAVVSEKGETGCVPQGTARTGESCDGEHCQVDLTCLGSPGDRRCYKLCRTTATAGEQTGQCGPMQTCMTGSIFVDTTFGVCRCGSDPQCTD